jgi:Xaa-Pro aminopeptidase
VTALLIVGDTFRTPELRHEVPLGIPDAFLFVETNGTRRVVVTSLELERTNGLDGLEAHAYEEFGYDELIARGLAIDAIRGEVYVNACAAFGVETAVVPSGFPLATAERLRQAGIDVTPNQSVFDERRRVKNRSELAGIRRAQRAAEAGMQAAVDLLRQATGNGTLTVEGEPLTVELVKQRVEAAFLQHGASADEFIVARGAQAAVGHDMGSGPIGRGESIVVDLWPRDRDSACFADMTRTFVVGEAPAELREYHRLTKEALELAKAMIRPGVAGVAVYGAVCDHFEAAGFPTGRSKAAGTVLQDGFFHGLGHGVGLEVHERPWMGRYADDLVAGDVVTIEPGLYRKGFGGVRLEDLLLVTEDGCENLTDFPYDLDVTSV